MVRQVCCFILALIFAISAAAMPQAQVAESETWTTGLGGQWNLGYFHFVFSREFADEGIKRWRLIESELESANNEWAGDYESSDRNEMRLSFLRWAPRSGFVLARVRSCSADLRFLSYGSLNWSPPELLLLEPVPPAPVLLIEEHQLHAPPHETTYLPVTWRKRHYLVPRDKIGEFCLWTAGLEDSVKTDESLEESIFSKRGEESVAEAGLPLVPPGYEQFVRRPIDGTITRVGKSFIRFQRKKEPFNQVVIPVVLDVGADDGVRVGLALNLFGQGGGDQVIVTWVASRSSGGEIFRSVSKDPDVKLSKWGEDDDPEAIPIKVGMPVSTSWHKTR